MAYSLWGIPGRGGRDGKERCVPPLSSHHAEELDGCPACQDSPTPVVRRARETRVGSTPELSLTELSRASQLLLALLGDSVRAEAWGDLQRVGIRILDWVTN